MVYQCSVVRRRRYMSVHNVQMSFSLKPLTIYNQTSYRASLGMGGRKFVYLVKVT